MANSKDQRRRKRLLLSSLLTIFTDETIVTMAFSPVQPVATDYDRNIGSKLILDSTDRSHISCRPRRHLKVILMNDPTSEDWIVEDRKRHAVESSHDLTKIRSKLASWSIQQLLSALNERSIRYPPTASRNDLENIFADYLIHCHDSSTLEANDINRFQNVAADINLFHPTPLQNPPYQSLELILKNGFINECNDVISSRHDEIVFGRVCLIFCTR